MSTYGYQTTDVMGNQIGNEHASIAHVDTFCRKYFVSAHGLPTVRFPAIWINLVNDPISIVLQTSQISSCVQPRNFCKGGKVFKHGICNFLCHKLTCVVLADRTPKTTYCSHGQNPSTFIPFWKTKSRPMADLKSKTPHQDKCIFESHAAQ